MEGKSTSKKRKNMIEDVDWDLNSPRRIRDSKEPKSIIFGSRLSPNSPSGLKKPTCKSDFKPCGFV